MNRQEAINIVKKNWPDSSFTSLKEALEFLIPELMSTDNEKIKEAIIKGIIHAAEEGCFCADNYSVKECVAWLEKQGEYANFHNKIQIGDKPADKVEPRFKVGDWVVCKNDSHRVFQVIERSWPDAKYLDEKGAGGFLNVFTLDKQYRLWTIQDAKAGDLLADDYGIYIFDRFDEYDEKCFLCMGAYQHSQKVYENEHLLCSVEVHPATKEQRDTLMKAMTDAGYTFDFEKKELKKIEQKPVGWSEEDEKTFSYLEDVVDFCYRNQFVVDVQTCERVRQLVFRLKSLCFQSGWGKDDITRINEIIETLNIVQANRVRTQRMHYNKATIDKNIDWLKSLKDRVQPQSKQEWSGGDEAHLHSLITHLEQWIESNPDTTGADIQGENIAWLKSLRPQKQCSIDGQELQKNLDTIFKAIDKAKEELSKGNNGAALEALCIQYPGIPIQNTWKPSDEQMQVLSNAGNSYRPFEEGHKVLWSLYNDLKKLREE